MPKKQKKLVSELIPLSSGDKDFHEKWEPGRDLLNFPHPFRGLAAGPPHSGKTMIIKNILLRADPPFEKILCYHADSKSRDYEDCGVEMIDKIPDPQEWSWDKVKKLLIIDDVNYHRLSKEQQFNLESCFKFVSTHKNLSIIATAQNFHSMPVPIRRMSNLFICWRIPDETSFKTIANKCGVRQGDFMDIFDNFCPHYQDSLWIDLTIGTPAKLRRNGYEVIEVKKKSKNE